MPKKIRKEAFETNSSSMHSIVVPWGASFDEFHYDGWSDLTPDENGIVHVHDGEFGWGYESYTGAAGKASYALTYCTQWGEVKGELLEMLRKAIRQTVECNAVDFHYDNGYIDHQSSDVCAVAFESLENLKNFIFNYGIKLIIDNDNH